MVEKETILFFIEPLGLVFKMDSRVLLWKMSTAHLKGALYVERQGQWPISALMS